MSHLWEKSYLRQKLRKNICVAGGSLRAGSLLLLLFLLLLRRGLRSEIVPPPQYSHHNRSRDKNRRLKDHFSRSTDEETRDKILRFTSTFFAFDLFRSNRRREFSESNRRSRLGRELESRRDCASLGRLEFTFYPATCKGLTVSIADTRVSQRGTHVVVHMQVFRERLTRPSLNTWSPISPAASNTERSISALIFRMNRIRRRYA